MVMSPMLWAKHSPDRFDIYSAGLVLMQLAIPQLRSDRGLLAFNEAIKKADYDLEAWRAASRHGFAKHNAVLDADDGAGWKLAAAMLRKRTLEVIPPGHALETCGCHLSFRLTVLKDTGKLRAPAHNGDFVLI
jgi:hypothetical protein